MSGIDIACLLAWPSESQALGNRKNVHKIIAPGHRCCEGNELMGEGRGFSLGTLGHIWGHLRLS